MLAHKSRRWHRDWAILFTFFTPSWPWWTLLRIQTPFPPTPSLRFPLPSGRQLQGRRPRAPSAEPGDGGGRDTHGSGVAGEGLGGSGAGVGHAWDVRQRRMFWGGQVLSRSVL